MEALRSVFASHPDSLLRDTKVDIENPMDQADYPAIIIRYYEREIKNAGIAHEEWRETFEQITRTPTFTDPFDANNASAYTIESGTYNNNGILTSTPFVASPTSINIADRIETITRVRWNGEPIVIGQLFKGDKWIDGSGVYCEATLNVDPGKLDLQIRLRRGTKDEEIVNHLNLNQPISGKDYFILTRVVDDDVTFGIYDVDPTTEAAPINQINFTIPATDMVNLTGNGKTWLNAYSVNASTSFINQYSVNSLTVTLSRAFRRFKHLIYSGDIELAIYALSTYDRDLIADSLVEILAMADLEPWTNQLLQRIYNPDAIVKPTSIEHFVNLNTDKLGPFGESKQQVPWDAEDEMIYNVSYRVGVMGELYSRVPSTPVFGFVRQVDLYPYLGDLGEPVPNPNPQDPQPWQ